MPYTDWNYSTPNWTNNTSPPINQQNLIDMGNALQHMNITPAQLHQLNANPTDTLGTILTNIETSSMITKGIWPIFAKSVDGTSLITSPNHGLPCGYVVLNETKRSINIYINAYHITEQAWNANMSFTYNMCIPRGLYIKPNVSSSMTPSKLIMLPIKVEDGSFHIPNHYSNVEFTSFSTSPDVPLMRTYQLGFDVTPYTAGQLISGIILWHACIEFDNVEVSPY